MPALSLCNLGQATSGVALKLSCTELFQQPVGICRCWRLPALPELHDRGLGRQDGLVVGDPHSNSSLIFWSILTTSSGAVLAASMLVLPASVLVSASFGLMSCIEPMFGVVSYRAIDAVLGMRRQNPAGAPSPPGLEAANVIGKPLGLPFGHAARGH